MDFKEILERWEQSPEGQKAVDNSRFSHILREKDIGLAGPNHHDELSKATMRRMPVQDFLDLHGMRGEESIVLLRSFLSSAVAKNLKKVMIIHGKGLHSPDGKAVLKDLVYRELRQSKIVRFFQKASFAEGGSGAVWVILNLTDGND